MEMSYTQGLYKNTRQNMETITYYIIFIINGSSKAEWKWEWDTNARKSEWFNLSSIYLCSFKENIINFMYYFKCSNWVWIRRSSAFIIIFFMFFFFLRSPKRFYRIISFVFFVSSLLLFHSISWIDIFFFLIVV